MGPAEIASALSSLKTIGDLGKAMLDLRDATALQTKAYELTKEILNVQQLVLSEQAEQQKQLKKIQELEAQLKQLGDWEGQRERYVLTDHGGGTFSYVLKNGQENGEPPHKICPKCFEQRLRSILQHRGTNVWRQEMCQCMTCGSKYEFGVRHEPTLRASARRHGSWLSE